MKSKTGPVILLIVTLAVSALLYSLFVPSGDGDNDRTVLPGQTRPLPVETAEVSRETISDLLPLTGTVEPFRVARLASPAEGPVINIRVREGDRVAKGEELFSIGRTKGIDALVESLRTEAGKEADNLERTRKLLEKEAIPVEALDRAGSDYEKVLAELARAEESLRDYVVKAPFDGLVAEVFVREGRFALPREPLMEIYDPSSLVIRAAVPEKLALSIKIGTPVDITLDAYPDGRILSGEIKRLYPVLDFRLRTRTMEILPDQPVELLPGMFVRLNLKLRTVADALVVPVEAIQSSAEGDFVFVVNNNKAERRSVISGLEANRYIEIKSGLFVGDRVIIKGAEKLQEGDKVLPAGSGRPVNKQPDARDNRS